MTGHPFFDSGMFRGCGLGAFRAVILDFRPRLANRCSAITATVRNGSACSGRRGYEVRVRFYFSLPQRRIACLQQPECRPVRQRRQRRVLMRPEAAFPYVFAAEGAQHPLIGRRAER